MDFGSSRRSIILSNSVNEALIHVQSCLMIWAHEPETANAIRFSDSAEARSLMKLAHRREQLERDEGDVDRDEWLGDRLADHRRVFEEREDVVELQDNWLPKSKFATLFGG